MEQCIQKNLQLLLARVCSTIAILLQIDVNIAHYRPETDTLLV